MGGGFYPRFVIACEQEVKRKVAWIKYDIPPEELTWALRGREEFQAAAEHLASVNRFQPREEVRHWVSVSRFQLQSSPSPACLDDAFAANYARRMLASMA